MPQQKLGYLLSRSCFSAGHDACWINRVAPTAMIMCPCVDGLSHNEAEEIHPEWATAGANVLFQAVIETAEIVNEKNPKCLSCLLKITTFRDGK
ncbi:MAG: hypothetical protein CM15mP62_26450 [Rhodospirillaceae bacterium]|nr:MAG: hypothetical protein CM15mP62_26450 [Rhodospirillaceae bacterium]